MDAPDDKPHGIEPYGTRPPKDPLFQRLTPKGRSVRPDEGLGLKRTPLAKGDPFESLRTSFTHWLHDETQDPYAQRAFRVLLRNKDMKIRLEAWKLAAVVLAPSVALERTKGNDQKVAIQFVNKVARPEKVVPAG